MFWAYFCSTLFVYLPACSTVSELKTAAAIFWLVLVSLFAIKDDIAEPRG